MILYAVIDTNVLVSALLTPNPASPTKAVLHHIHEDNVTPMINDEIIR